jgi:hypothetical protein
MKKKKTQKVPTSSRAKSKVATKSKKGKKTLSAKVSAKRKTTSAKKVAKPAKRGRPLKKNSSKKTTAKKTKVVRKVAAKKTVGSSKKMVAKNTYARKATVKKVAKLAKTASKIKDCSGRPPKSRASAASLKVKPLIKEKKLGRTTKLKSAPSASGQTKTINKRIGLPAQGVQTVRKLKSGSAKGRRSAVDIKNDDNSKIIIEKNWEKQVEVLFERGRREGFVVYEDLISFSNKYILDEEEVNEIIRLLEKDNIDLIFQEELDSARNHEHPGVSDEPVSAERIKPDIKLSLQSAEDTEEPSDDDIFQAREAAEKAKEQIGEQGQLNDPVKLYLKEIGKISLLNKVTEKAISSKIAKSKRVSIDTIAEFPFAAKELISIGERVEKDPLILKDFVQFSDFYEDNSPKLEGECKKFLSTIKKIKCLVHWEYAIYRSYRSKG